MERQTKVSVFESDSQEEIQLVKSMLENQGIATFNEEGNTSSNSNLLSIIVDIKQEQAAFDIIDAYLLEQDQEESSLN